MEGHRVEKKQVQTGFHWGLAIAGLAGVAVLSGYFGLCSWVGGGRTVMPNVTVSGVDVSGMNATQTWEAMDRAVAQYGPDATVTLKYGSWSGTISCDELQRDNAVCTAEAVGVGRESFLTNGAAYLSHLAGASTDVGMAAGTLSVAQPALDRLLQQADEEIGGAVRQYDWKVGSDEVSLTKGKTGTSFDRDMVYQLVAVAADEALRQTIAQGQAVDVPVDLAEQEGLVESAPPEVPDFQALHDEVYVEPVSAEMDPETLEISDHVMGVDFDTEALRTAFEEAPEGGTVTLPLKLTEPEETKESLQGKLFQDVLGQATSKLDRNANRTSNVRRSAQSCNGVVVMPDEVFSYNSTTGPRSAANGYLTSTVYVGTQTVQETGGGVCQTSSTLYYAVLHTTLEVVERHNHRFAVGYVPDGMDATVYDGSPDFRFKNNTGYPLKVETYMYEKDGSTYLTVTLRGTNVTGRYAKPESNVYDWVNPTTSYVADGSVPQGTLVLDREQNAYKGRKATTVRRIYEADGTLVETQTMGSSTYAMRPNLYHYNPLDGDPSTWVDGKPPAPGTVTEPENPDTPVSPETPTQPTEPQTPAEPETPPAQPEIPEEVPAAPEANVDEGQDTAA